MDVRIYSSVQHSLKQKSDGGSSGSLVMITQYQHPLQEGPKKFNDAIVVRRMQFSFSHAFLILVSTSYWVRLGIKTGQ
jgi:hypothetical protein